MLNLDNVSIKSEIGVAAALEAKRLSQKYGKDYFDCEDLVQIMGVGRNNIRQLFNSKGFPTVEIGNRRVVSAIAFALWSLTQRNI
jgi:hypothetical protein